MEMSQIDQQSIAVITGACGGIGQACARQLGLRHRLLLADVSDVNLLAEACKLKDEGYIVAGSLTMNVACHADVAELARVAQSLGELGALVHTAGLSASMADWQTIMQVNLVGTALLLDAFLPLAGKGSVVVCTASITGYGTPPEGELAGIIDQPLADNIMDRLEPYLTAMSVAEDPLGKSSQAYGLSKRGVIRLCEKQVSLWGGRGARIVSVSPGLIDTPLLKKEIDANPDISSLPELTPLHRFGNPIEIASVVNFLCSAAASYITGCDVRVDGGLLPILKSLSNK